MRLLCLIASLETRERINVMYVMEYKDGDGEIIALYIKTPPKVFSYGVTQYSKNSAWKMAFNVEDREEWVNDYRKI